MYFDITAENTTEENGVTIVKTEKKNATQKGTITVEKTGEVFSNVVSSGEEVLVYQPEYSVSGLAGAVFEIYADEDITTPDGTARAKKDTLVDTITTEQNGTATGKELYLGKYRVVETVAPYGTVIPKDGLIEIITCDENGKAKFTTDLPIGNYYVKEISTDCHYILSDKKTCCF